MTVFSKKLLSCGPAVSAQIEAVDYRDRIYYSLVDLVCLCMFLSVSPQIKEANLINFKFKFKFIVFNFI